MQSCVRRRTCVTTVGGMYACARLPIATAAPEPPMDHVALRLPGPASWTHLGGDDAAKKPLEVVVRSYDRDLEFATGEDAEGPAGEAVRVPRGEGRRLEGRHFFVRPVQAGAPCRLSYRGL